MQKQTEEYKSKFYKKGQAGVAVSSIITLIVGVGVATLVLIFVGSLGGQTYNLVESDIEAISGTVVNESFTATAGTAVQLSNGGLNSGTVTITNSTGAVGATEFQLALDTGKVTYLAGGANAGATLNASYDHGTPAIESSAKAGIVNAFEALEQSGNYLPIIVLAVVISLVLALVLSFTAFGSLGGRGGGSAL